MWSRSIPDDRGVAETFVALKPRATSSGYGDLIQLAATAASGKQGRKDEGSARPMAHFTVRGTQNLLSGNFDGRLGQGSPDECGLDQARLWPSRRRGSFLLDGRVPPDATASASEVTAHEAVGAI